ncbi:hypothetical protein M758_9G021300 [Ceratodon purpureus]|nr:hypothetical protein M758_9G021300 [Ceratodon purpureus]
MSSVVEIMGDWRSNYITCPSNPKEVLAITLPFFIIIVKNMRFFYSFEVKVLDDKNMKRTFRLTNITNKTRGFTTLCILPLRLFEGWNMIQFDLADFCAKVYGTTFVETLSVKINANCRIRHIYFSDRLYTEDELKYDYRFFLPIQNWLQGLVQDDRRDTILQMEFGKIAIIRDRYYNTCRKLEGVRVDGLAPIRRRRPKVCEGCPS